MTRENRQPIRRNLIIFLPKICANVCVFIRGKIILIYIYVKEHLCFLICVCVGIFKKKCGRYVGFWFAGRPADGGTGVVSAFQTCLIGEDFLGGDHIQGHVSRNVSRTLLRAEKKSRNKFKFPNEPIICIRNASISHCYWCCTNQEPPVRAHFGREEYYSLTGSVPPLFFSAHANLCATWSALL